jgi:hypothetical protein
MNNAMPLLGGILILKRWPVTTPRQGWTMLFGMPSVLRR